MASKKLAAMKGQGSARNLAQGATSMMTVEGEKLQRLRVEIEDVLEAFSAKKLEFDQREREFVAKYSERAFVMLAVPPCPSLTRRMRKASVVDDEAELTTDDFIATLQSRGFNITKHGRKGKPHKRRLWLTSDAKRLNVSDSGGMSSKGLPLSEVIAGRIVEGFQTAVFQRSGCHAASEDCCMSIIAKSRSLDIECETEAERNQLVLGLRSLVLHILFTQLEQQDEVTERVEVDRSRARSASRIGMAPPAYGGGPEGSARNLLSSGADAGFESDSD